MKTKMTNVLIALQAVAAAVMVGAIKIWAPVCGKMLLMRKSGKRYCSDRECSYKDTKTGESK